MERRMRAHLIVLVILTIALAGCADGSGLGTDGTLPDGNPPDGTLLVSTSTAGNDPDQDGYRLAVDSAAGVPLVPTGTVAIGLPPGPHVLRLLGIAPQCLVASDTILDVDVPSKDTIPVAFEIHCPATGALITVTTTGLDLDTDGYRVLVDGAERARVGPDDRALTDSAAARTAPLR